MNCMFIYYRIFNNLIFGLRFNIAAAVNKSLDAKIVFSNFTEYGNEEGSALKIGLHIYETNKFTPISWKKS